MRLRFFILQTYHTANWEVPTLYLLVILNGTAKEKLYLVEWRGILKSIQEMREGASVNINLCKTTKMTTIILSVREVIPLLLQLNHYWIIIIWRLRNF